ncbi:KICSTOR complex protein SZT2 [Latimeria chalumnae]|uniref:KICSTOR complex protein SZT2 n=1 Tax=Latimeria chalumnae TaxID=7897 RepID=UPI00313B5A15
MAERQQDTQVEEASQVFLLMKKEYRISRNVRLAWFLGNLHHVIHPTPRSELFQSEDELEVLSILPKGWQPGELVPPASYLLVPCTRVTFLALQYRFVIELDVSPSTSIVDDSTGEMIFDEVFHALSRCLVGLLRPFKIPGTDIDFRPEIFVTILAYSSIIGLQSHQVLVQGCRLDQTNMDLFLQNISHQLGGFENSVVEVLQQQYALKEQVDLSILNSTSPVHMEEQPPRKKGVSMVTADVGLVSMVRQGMLALQLLPLNSSAGIIIITDGVTSVPDIAVCETLLNQLRSGTVACSFIQVGGAYSYDCSFGYVPNVELMKFVAMATFGSYMSSCPEVDLSSQDMNAYHKAFLLYSFIKTGDSMNPEYYCASQHKLFNEHLVSASSNPALAMRRKKHTEKEVHANLVCVVSVRLREGYSIREVNLAKAGSQLEVKLVLLWKHNMRIEYLASAPWPLDPSKRSTWVEVTMEGSYDILHDISCTMRKPISSLYRTTVIRRFWNTLQSINQTDQMLVHLQSFNTIPEHFTIPESTKNGVPLFYIPPGSTTPVLSLQHSGSKDSSQSQFASYWKPILSMDANFWQRWLHMHRISIILEHDTPVPKHLHTPGSNGRYSTIQCRISHSALTSLLRDWSSFVLVEGYSYVKLIYSSTDQSPSFFYLVRIISKAPCMVLRLGFPIGTPAFTRNKIVDELRDQILLLRFPHRVQSKEATPKVKRKILGGVSPSVSPPLPPAQPALSDRPCVEVLTKPLEKLLIRYEKLPSDYRTSFILNLESASQSSAVPGPVTVATSRTASSMLASLSRYYYHRRWIWSVHSGLAPGVPLAAVAQILAMITEIRLSEGFHFAASGDGIVNMVIELPMKSNALDESGGEIHTCLVQYILFPPHSISTKDSFSTDDDNDTEVEAIEYDTELNLVTECWVEPQSGHVTSPSENHRHLNGLSYLEIPKAIYPRDQACMSTMLTFEYLCQLCLNKDHASPICGAKCTAGDRLGDTEHIHEIPFQFDLMKLLPKCQQVEIFFLTLSKEDAGSVQEGSPLPNDTLLSLFHGCLQQDLSDREIPLADLDHVTFMQQVLQRERDGHVPPFTLPAVKEDTMKPSRPSEREDAAMSFHAMGSSKEVTGSTSTLQSLGNTELIEEDALPGESEISLPQWRCYAKYVSPQQIFLIFIPATFSDVQKLTTLGPDRNAKHDDLGGEEMLEVQVIKPAPAAPSGGLQPKSELSAAGEDRGSPEVPAEGVPSMGGVDGSKATLPPSQQESVPSRPAPAMPLTQMEELPGLETGGENVTSQTEAVSDCGELGALPAKELHFSFSHQMSQLDPNDSSRLRCPVYVYNCSFELLRGQLVTPHLDRPVKDVFFSEFRSQDFGCWEIFPEKKPRCIPQEQPSSSCWSDPMVHRQKHKELVNYCNLLQEYYHQSYVKGLFRSLQQSFSVASQDLLTAMDYCEELLQEIEITTFLQTLCGHIRTFRESHDLQRAREAQRQPTTFVIGRRGRGEEASRERGVLTSVSSAEMEDYSEPESRSVSSAVASPVTAEEPKAKQAYPEFPLSLLQSGQPCEVYPNLHKIIQDKFLEIGRQHFKTVPSNPFYFFYCPPSAKKEEEPCPEDGSRKPSEDADLSEADFALEEGNVSGCCIATESDPDLEVEYRDRSDRELQDSSDSASDSNTVNQDDDSFSVLGGDSLNEQDVLEQEMPPLFVHLTCSVKVKSCHGSLPVQSLPTCLGEVIGCVENAQTLQCIDLNDLSVTLDIFVLMLPLEIEDLTSEIHHNRYTSESSISLTRSPGQPSSYRSDDGMMPNMDHLTSAADDGLSAADPLSKLPITHRQAVEATMSEIHWLLEDEIVSALRHSKNIGVSTLRQVSEHVYRSHGRPRCHMEVVPLQFVFGSEQSLEKFKEEFRRMTLPGHLLNEEDHYFYVSRSRYHSQRLAMAMKATEPSPGSETESRVAAGGDEVGARQQQDGENEAEAAPEVVIASDSEKSREKKVEREEFQDGKPECAAELRSDGNTAPPSEQPERATAPALVTEQTATDGLQPQQSPATESSEKPPSKNSSIVSLTELAHSAPHGSVEGSRQHPSRVQSVVSSQGSMESDLLGYDGDSSESECEGGTMSTQEPRCPLMPDFWLIIEILHDRVKVYSHARDLAGVKDSSEVKEDKGSEEEPEHFCLHRTVVKKIGELCRVANQRLLLQDLHDSHVCNSLLVAESEEDIWKSETSYNSYRQRIIANDDYSADESYQSRDYLAATMQFIPGHFACDVVWKTIIYIHPRLKMGPNMGVARAIQALRSVLTAFSVVNRKNMFVYQERSTKSVFYLRLSETTCTGRLTDMDSNLSLSRSLALTRSQEPIYSEDLSGSRSSLEFTPSRSSEPSRPVGQVDKHILLMVHGVGAAGPEITDELVKVLRRRLDEATLDIITVMLVRNCKLTPADVEFIQPPNTTPTEVIQFTIPQSSLAWLHAVAYYLRQNLLIFLHTPKYTDSNIENHFQHCVCQDRSHSSADIYLYNKPGGQGTGGKGIACVALSFVDEHGQPIHLSPSERAAPLKLDPAADLLRETEFDALTSVSQHSDDPDARQPGSHTLVRFDIWEQGNISLLQLTDKLRGAIRHALCDVVMEFRVLQAPLCVESSCPLKASGHGDDSSGPLRRSLSEAKGVSTGRSPKPSPAPLQITPLTPSPSSGAGNPESTTPTGRSGLRSFWWDMLSKPESSELGAPKTTDDIVLERADESRTRRRHKTENVKQLPGQERSVAVEMEQAQRQAAARRKRLCHLEEGDVGALHPLFGHTCQQWMAFMCRLGCPSIQRCSVDIVSRFLLSSILTETMNLVTNLANDTTVKVFERIGSPLGSSFLPRSPSQHSVSRPAATRHFILIGRNFHQWRYSTEQAHKGFQRFEAPETSSVSDSPSAGTSGKEVVPRQRFLIIDIIDKKMTLYTYNWSVDLGATLNRNLTQLIQWQNARSHVVYGLLNQKMGLFHHYCFADAPGHDENKQDPNPFLNSSLEADTLIRTPMPPASKEQNRLSGASRGPPSLHFPTDIVPFDEVLRDISVLGYVQQMPDSGISDPVSRHGTQYLEIKNMERREMEKQLKIENLFVTWQQRSAESNMPITVADLETLKQSSRLVHYCATPLLFDPLFRQQIQAELRVVPEGKKRHRSNDSTASGRDRSHSCDSVEMLSSKLKEEPWLVDIFNIFMQQYIQYLQSTGFILVQVRPPSPARSSGRIRSLACLTSEGRSSFSYSKQKSEESPKSGSCSVPTYHLQRALPGGIVLMELAFQGCYFCVKQYALECSRIPMGQSVNSQLSMLFTEECDKVRDLMHVHSFSYDFHLRIVHQYLVGCHMTLHQGYHLTGFLEDFISQHPDIPKFGRNHVFQGTLALPTSMITAHQLYNYITDHAGTYGMKPLRMSKTTVSSDSKKGSQYTELHEYALVALWNSSGSYKDSEGLRHHDDFDVSLLVCHSASPFEEQTETERHLLRLCFYVIMTSQRELFPRLTADMRRFKKLPQLRRDPLDHLRPSASKASWEKTETDLWEEEGEERQAQMGGSIFLRVPRFQLLLSEVALAQKRIGAIVQEAKSHCRRDNLWQRLFLGENLSSDKLKLSKLSFPELEELLKAVQSKSISEIDPQLDCFVTMNVSWYQGLIKVLLTRFPQSCRHFVDNDNGIQYLAVLNQKFIDCFVLVYLDVQAGKTSLKVVFREPFPVQPQNSESPLPQLVSMYHHLESVINTACFNLWTGLL